jgi:hypothetical protein
MSSTAAAALLMPVRPVATSALFCKPILFCMLRQYLQDTLVTWLTSPHQVPT